eukprot:scaffold1501_cov158-Amphora_coffeaeformis.AAC.4
MMMFWKQTTGSFSGALLRCLGFFLLVFLSTEVQVYAQQHRCGCADCTPLIFNSDAQGQTCSERIDARMTSQSVTETEACEWVAQTYPLSCGPEW